MTAVICAVAAAYTLCAVGVLFLVYMFGPDEDAIIEDAVNAKKPATDLTGRAS